jgi:mRNA degradation ribonuclease J1/J2
MAGQMDESYFEEKKQLAKDAVASAVQTADEARALIAATSYSMSDLVDPRQIHQLLQTAAVALHSARRDYEKARWAAARTQLEFEPWLDAQGQSDLRLTRG